MKVYNLSYNDKERLAEVYAITGKPYGFFRSLRRGGSGSVRGYLIEAPENIMKLFEGFSYQKYCNIQELRSGIIIGFRSRLESFGIPLGFSELTNIEFEKSTSKTYPTLLRIHTADNESILIGYKQYEEKGIRKFLSGLNTDKD